MALINIDSPLILVTFSKDSRCETVGAAGELC